MQIKMKARVNVSRSTGICKGMRVSVCVCANESSSVNVSTHAKMKPSISNCISICLSMSPSIRVGVYSYTCDNDYE